MGGQACVLYGAAEFSRDVDLLLEESDEALERLLEALKELQAERIAVPPFRREHLERGLAVHFRCHHPEAAGIRVDVMTRLRGLDDFETLWARRTTIAELFDLLSLPDLVQAKKTQRDKDWPMLRRLVEAHFFQHSDHPTPEQLDFWQRELRTPELLESAGLKPRPLRDEEEREREADRAYWRPLKELLERLRQETAPAGDPEQELLRE